MGSASPFDEFPEGTLGGIDEHLRATLWMSNPKTNQAPTSALTEIGLHPDDLALWPAALDKHPTAVGGPTVPEVAWSVLANKITALSDIAPWLTVHEALAWLIADMPAVTDLIGSDMLLMGWAQITAHGWLPHAAGVSLDEFEQDRPSERQMRVMAGLRGHVLPPLRSPETLQET